MPRTDTTRRLEGFKYQFYQWFYVDKFTISQVTVLFEWLFSILHVVTGEEYGATKEQWLSRQREWNKKWQLRKSDPCVPAPKDLVGQRAWFRKRDDNLLLLNTSLLTEYTRHEKPGFIRKVDLGDAAIGRDSGPQQSSQNRNTGDHSFGHSPSTADHDSRPGTIEDSFVDTPDLHEKPAEARNVYAGCFSPTPYLGNTEARPGNEANKDSLLYLFEGSVSRPSSARPPEMGPKRPDNVTNESNSSLDRSRPSSHQHTQRTPFTTTLPTRDKSNRYYLPVNHADAGFAGMIADSATLDAYQPTNDAASYSTDAVLASSNLTSLHQPSMPYFCPPPTIPGLLPDNHPSVHDVGVATGSYGSLVSAAWWNSLSLARGTGAPPLMVSQWPAQLIGTDAEAFSRTHSAGPYPRWPSNQPSFMQYDRNGGLR